MVIRGSRTIAVLGAALLLGACASLLGVEERRLREESDGTDGGPKGSGGRGEGGGSGEGGTTPPGAGSVGGGPSTTGGAPSTCASSWLPAACQDCFCTQCDQALQDLCAGGSTCLDALTCIQRTGCPSPAGCMQPGMCESEMADLGDPGARDALFACLSDCSGCLGATGCVDGQGCQTPMNTPGVCMGGNCQQCAAPLNTTDRDCERAYGASRPCCGSGAACAACPSADCAGAVEADPCTTAPTPNGRGVCVGGGCYACNAAPGMQDANCMANSSASTPCCSAANQCVACPQTNDCTTLADGTSCSLGAAMTGLCYAGSCRSCPTPGGPDPMCEGLYGTAQGCCNATQTGCAPCGTTGSCAGVACPAGHVCTAGTCGPCALRGMQDPACSATWGAPMACCSAAGTCQACTTSTPTELVDTIPPALTAREISWTLGGVAWTSAGAGGAGTLRGIQNDAVPAGPLYPIADATGPLGSDGQGAFVWSSVAGIRSYNLQTALSQTIAPNTATAVTASGAFVFWTAGDGTVQRANVDGSGGITQIANLPVAGTSIVVSGNNVYWAVAGEVYRTTVNGGVATSVAGGPAMGTVVDFGVMGNDIYWLGSEGAGGTVRRQTAGSPATFVPISGTQTFGAFGGMALVGPQEIFFTAETGLYRLQSPVGTLPYTLTKLADLQAPVGGVAYTTSYIYFIEAGGREVRRMPRP